MVSDETTLCDHRSLEVEGFLASSHNSHQGKFSCAEYPAGREEAKYLKEDKKKTKVTNQRRTRLRIQKKACQPMC